MNKWIAFIFLVSLAGLFAPYMKPHDSQFYFQRGSRVLATASPDHRWVYQWNLNNAQADFSRAIRLNPGFTSAYIGRADAEVLGGDTNGALRDYSSAIQLDPQNPSNYVRRAEIELRQNDFESALNDFDKAIAVQPVNWRAYRGRVRVRELQNDFAGAAMERVRMIEETPPGFIGPDATNGGFFMRNPGRVRDRLLQQLDRALETDTNFAWGYYYRGVARFVTNDWNGALADFQHCQSLPDGRVKDEAALFTWLAREQMGNKETADRELLDYCRNRRGPASGDWQINIAKFLLNQINESDFSKAIDPPGSEREQSEFWYYTGMKRLLADDKTGAMDCFRKALITKERPCAVFLSAETELNSPDPPQPAE